ncbi:D-amino-acid transaminase [Acidisoma cellulosilytica]|uniref:Probable branched-chain-amino-acid aminotransferase n=1 Tax=Acidisoma cellulosilyticum TaxID=2802395 RepID=A0A964E3C4_9PROT|nr:D-amino-acid transaminase [Acidisoma cellulosilyticum]MCB8880306.1 D-amino-acid transaminase [Acidisoma cellulosilyticum]
MSRIAYVNGRYLPVAAAQVRVEDRGFLFGDGVYEVVQVYRGRFVDEEKHLNRLTRSLGELRLAWPVGRRALEAIIREVVTRNRLHDNALVYIQITRGAAKREHVFPKPGTRTTLVVTARAIPAFPRDVDAWATSIITGPDQRWDRCDIKTVNLLPNVLAKQAAKDAGAFEMAMVDGQGMVTECASSNIWIVDEHGQLRTRALGHEILPGCTRAALSELLGAEGLTLSETAFSLDELRRAQEVFITSATSFVRPITRIDGASVQDGAVGPVTRRLFAAFARHVQGGLPNAA